MRIVLLGPPGAGKGTQASILSKKFNIVHVSTGDIFRYHMEQKTALGIKSKEYVDKGQLVPDNLVIEITEDRIIQDDCKHGYLLDGFPRNIYQAKTFDSFLGKHSLQLDAVIYIDVDDNEIIERISGRRICSNCKAIYNINMEKVEKCKACGGKLINRSDQSREVVEHRIKVYHEQTKPLIDYYNEKGILLDVQGLGTIEEVTQRIMNHLGSKSL